VSINSFADQHPSASLAHLLHEQTAEFAGFLLRQFAGNCPSLSSFALSSIEKLAEKLEVSPHLRLFADRQERFVRDFSEKFSEESRKALNDPLTCEKCEKLSLSKNKFAWVDEVLKLRNQVGMSAAVWQAIAQDALELFAVNLGLDAVQVSRTLRCFNEALIQCV
jgi:hypothetical protein